MTDDVGAADGVFFFFYHEPTFQRVVDAVWLSLAAALVAFAEGKVADVWDLANHLWEHLARARSCSETL